MPRVKSKCHRFEVNRYKGAAMRDLATVEALFGQSYYNVRRSVSGSEPSEFGPSSKAAAESVAFDGLY